MGSDHYPVVTSIGVAPSTAGFRKRSTWKFGSGTWENWTVALQQPELQGMDDLQREFTNFTRAVLSPLLFNIMVYDTPVVEGICSCEYADDLAFYTQHPNLRIATDTLQQQLTALHNWSKQWGLKINLLKNKCMLFTNKRINPLPITVGGQQLEFTKQLKYLGDMLDSPQLHWHHQVEYLKQSCATLLNLLQSISHRHWGADRELLIYLYKTLIRSRLDYAAPLYDSGSQRSTTGLKVETYICTDVLPTSVSSETNQNVLQMYHELIDTNYSGYTHIFTDGSCIVEPTCSASAAVVISSRGVTINFKLRPQIHIMECELIAINEALQWILLNNCQEDKYVIFSDSLSSLHLIQNTRPKNYLPLVFSIQEKLFNIASSHWVYLQFIPGHKGIPGNEAADETAKNAHLLRYRTLTPSSYEEIKNPTTVSSSISKFSLARYKYKRRDRFSILKCCPPIG
ncbi:Ribonuclease H domain [Trinorchestia longiramus]|nr:Ribonuclease H domain [Trinorchestia longiramus]